ncbi:MAG: ImmA/IrrE family metallo-endopeptidase [Thermoanaerobaculia bacterium]
MRGRAEREAVALLEELGIASPAVNVEDIATKLGIAVVRAKLEDNTSAMLIRKGSEALIMLDEGQVRERQRFSIAHELGHFRLHQEPVFVDKSPMHISYRNTASSLAQEPREIEANAFAAELLMPGRWVCDEVERLRNSGRSLDEDELVMELKKTFKVSEPAIKFRLLNLGLISSF